MSSNDEYKKMREWLIKNYPTEMVFIDEINKNVNEIFQKYGLPNLKTNEIQNLLFTVTKREQTDFPEFGVNSLATAMFLGGMAKAISDVILTEILPKIMPETKKCKQCGARNNSVVKYCFQCGNSEFEIS
jgi:hypothetical protein